MATSQNMDVHRDAPLVTQTYGLIGRARVFCEWLEPLLMLEFLHVKAAMDDLNLKLEMLRGTVLGLFDFCRSAEENRDREDTQKSPKLERLYGINQHFLDLLIAQCGAVLRSYEDRRAAAFDSQQPSRSTVDAIDLAASQVSHMTVLLSYWQRVLRDTFPEDIQRLADSLESSDRDRISGWEDLRQIRLPLDYEPVGVLEQALQLVDGSVDDANAVRCCLDGRRVFLASLYFATFRPLTWERRYYAQTVEATDRSLRQIQKIVEQSITRAERDGSEENLRDAMIDDQCRLSTLWRRDWISHELEPSRYVRSALRLEITESDSPSNFSWMSLAAGYLGRTNRRLDPVREMPAAMVGLVCSVEQHVQFDFVLGEHLDLWGYDPSSEVEMREFEDYAITLVTTDNATKQWAKRLTNSTSKTARPVRLLFVDDKLPVGQLGCIDQWPVVSFSKECLDVPWLMSHIATHPWLTASAQKPAACSGPSQVDWYAQEERIHAVVGLACQELDRLMVSRSENRRRWLTSESALVVFEMLKRSLVRLLPSQRHRVDNPQPARGRLIDFVGRVASILDGLSNSERSAESLTPYQAELAAMEQELTEFPWLLLPIVVLRFVGDHTVDSAVFFGFEKRDTDTPELHGLNNDTLRQALNDILQKCGLRDGYLEVKDSTWRLRIPMSSEPADSRDEVVARTRAH